MALWYLRQRWADLLSVVLIVSYHVGVSLVVGDYVLDHVGVALAAPSVGAGAGDEGLLIRLAVAVGALGAMLHAMAFSIHVARDTHDWRWVPFHVLQPLRGAILGLIVYLGARAGIFLLSGDAGASPTAHAVLFFAAVAGLFASAIIHGLRERFPLLRFDREAARAARVPVSEGASASSAAPPDPPR